MRGAFAPLPLQAKAAIAVVFLWMLAVTVGVTVALVVQKRESNSRYTEQQQTAQQAYLNCIRTIKFAPELVIGFNRLHILSPEGVVEYKRLIPENCSRPGEKQSANPAPRNAPVKK